MFWAIVTGCVNDACPMVRRGLRRVMRATSRRVYDINTDAGRRAATRDFNWNDHQILRKRWTNLSEFAPGLWRSNQPSAARLTQYKALGIRTIVSLRGDSARSYNQFEREACKALGLELHHIHISSARELPAGAQLLESIEQLSDLPRPLLLHCKSGADRTGFAAALVLILVEGGSVQDAARQMTRKHIHFPRSKSGVLGHVFRVYMRDAEPSGQGFRTWLEKGYDPDAITADFKDWRIGAGRWA